MSSSLFFLGSSVFLGAYPPFFWSLPPPRLLGSLPRVLLSVSALLLGACPLFLGTFSPSVSFGACRFLRSHVIVNTVRHQRPSNQRGRPAPLLEEESLWIWRGAHPIASPVAPPIAPPDSPFNFRLRTEAGVRTGSGGRPHCNHVFHNADSSGSFFGLSLRGNPETKT